MPRRYAKGLVRKDAARMRKASNLARLRTTAMQKVDMSDIPEVTMDGLGESHRIVKQLVTLRLDADVLRYFKNARPGYQTRINQILRSAIRSRRTVRDELHDAAVRIDQIAGRL